MPPIIPPIHIQIVNESTVVSDADAIVWMQAEQAQVDEDWSPHYGIHVVLAIVPKGRKPNAGIWQLIIADDSNQANALGYHETTANDDPIGFAFAKTSAEDGESWTVVASHELLEMLADPGISAVKEQDNADGSMTFRFKEICDPVEGDNFGYTKNGPDGEPYKLADGTAILVSDFVLPRYWDVEAPTGTKFDIGGFVTAPLQILTGGYMSILQIPATLTWSQITADGHPGGKTVRPFNRRARHKIPRSEWKRSER